MNKKEIALKAKPWINKNTQALMREHDRQFKCYCNDNNPSLRVAKHNKYKNAQNAIIFKVKKSKNKHYQIYFQKHLRNVKTTWDGIESIVTLKSKDKTTPNSLMINGNVIINKNGIAKIFNDFFC